MCYTDANNILKWVRLSNLLLSSLWTLWWICLCLFFLSSTSTSPLPSLPPSLIAWSLSWFKPLGGGVLATVAWCSAFLVFLFVRWHLVTWHCSWNYTGKIKNKPYVIDSSYLIKKGSFFLVFFILVYLLCRVCAYLKLSLKGKKHLKRGKYWCRKLNPHKFSVGCLSFMRREMSRDLHTPSRADQYGGALLNTYFQFCLHLVIQDMVLHLYSVWFCIQVTALATVSL